MLSSSCNWDAYSKAGSTEATGTGARSAPRSLSSAAFRSPPEAANACELAACMSAGKQRKVHEGEKVHNQIKKVYLNS